MPLVSVWEALRLHDLVSLPAAEHVGASVWRYEFQSCPSFSISSTSFFGQLMQCLSRSPSSVQVAAAFTVHAPKTWAQLGLPVAGNVLVWI